MRQDPAIGESERRRPQRHLECPVIHRLDAHLAEVGDLARLDTVLQKDVGRLDVAVDESLLMRRAAPEVPVSTPAAHA